MLVPASDQHAWYGTRLIHQLSRDWTRVTPIRQVHSAVGDPALLLSIHCFRSHLEVPGILQRANVPIWSVNRTEEHPLVIAGGGACYNPEPIADMVDVFCIGDGEDFIQALPKCLAETTRTKRLRAIAELPGAYVPAWRKFQYDKTGMRVLDVTGEQRPIYATRVNYWTPPPQRKMTASRREIEVARGCRGKCFFCLLTWTKPYRERSWEDFSQYIDETTPLGVFASNIAGVSYAQRIPSSMLRATYPGYRIDDFLRLPFPEEGAYKGWAYTAGVEGINERLRKILGKPFKESQIAETVHRLAVGKPTRAQFYYIRCVPSETAADWEEFIPRLRGYLEELVQAGIPFETTFIPLVRTPHTPLQWCELTPARLGEHYVLQMHEEARAWNQRTDVKGRWRSNPPRSEWQHLVDNLLSQGGRRMGQLAVHYKEIESYVSRFSKGRDVYYLFRALKALGIESSREELYAGFDDDTVFAYSHIKPFGEEGEKRVKRVWKRIQSWLVGTHAKPCELSLDPAPHISSEGGDTEVATGALHEPVEGREG